MTDAERFARAMERMSKLMAAISAAGAIAFLIWRGWPWAAGWILGCAASALNFRWLKRMTESLGSPNVKPRGAALFGVRYLLLGGGAYVILKFTAVSLLAALVGLFIATAAVIVEILIELTYARN